MSATIGRRSSATLTTSRPLGRLRSAAVVAASLLLMVSGSASTAVAAPSTSSRSAPIGSTALPTVQINGVVWNQVVIGGLVVAGGKLHQGPPGRVRPAGQTRSPVATCWPTA